MCDCARAPCTVFQYTFWSIKSQWLTEIFWGIFLQKAYIQTVWTRTTCVRSRSVWKIHTNSIKMAIVCVYACSSMNERKQNKTHTEWKTNEWTNWRTNGGREDLQTVTAWCATTYYRGTLHRYIIIINVRLHISLLSAKRHPANASEKRSKRVTVSRNVTECRRCLGASRKRCRSYDASVCLLHKKYSTQFNTSF